MPVIRGQSNTTALPAARRKDLLKQLAAELAGKSTANGPVVFEIPLDQSGKMDVLVVWKEFEALSSEDRTSVIIDAYKDRKKTIAQALGVTYHEAIEQHLLPYAVVPMTRHGEVDPAELRGAMLAEGGFALSEEKADLRLPSMAMAEAAHRRLCEKLPRGYWSISYAVAPID